MLSLRAHIVSEEGRSLKNSLKTRKTSRLTRNFFSLGEWVGSWELACSEHLEARSGPGVRVLRIVLETVSASRSPHPQAVPVSGQASIV